MSQPVGSESSRVPSSTTLSREGLFTAEVILSPENQRIQVLNYQFDDPGVFIEELTASARDRDFGKVWLKARGKDAPVLRHAGMIEEAVIEGYFDGEDAHVLAVFVDSARLKRPHLEDQQQILDSVHSSPRDDQLSTLPENYSISMAEETDLVELAVLYATVFASYPYPIDNAEYLLGTMRENVVYAVIRDGPGRLVAAASGETVPALHCSEMTDFATLPSQRRKGLAQHLLRMLEEEMARRAIGNLYTIARSKSYGMNRTFYNSGYHLTGTLVNNCHISGDFEDMHVWCKTLNL